MKHHGQLFMLAVAVLLLATSCSLILGDDPQDDALSVYDSFWSILDRDYAGFYTKTGEAWEAVRLAYRGTIAQDPDMDTLRSACGDIITRLNDGHMILFAGTQEISVIPDYAEIPFDFLVVRERYLTDEQWDSSEIGRAHV